MTASSITLDRFLEIHRAAQKRLTGKLPASAAPEHQATRPQMQSQVVKEEDSAGSVNRLLNARFGKHTPAQLTETEKKGLGRFIDVLA